MSSDISVWYDFVLQQMAAEAYFEGVDLEDEAVVKVALRQGNNRPGFVADRITTFTDDQSVEFIQKFEIVDQWSDNPTSTGSRPTQPNDVGYLALDGQQILANTGLSATLIRRKDAAGNLTNDYTLAFRSTEYREVAEGGDRDRDVWGADVGGIFKDGFALAQLDALESEHTTQKSRDTQTRTNARAGTA